MVMFVLFVLLFLWALWRWKDALKGMIGVILAYVATFSVLGIVFTYVPSPMRVRLTMLLVSIGVIVKISWMPTFRDNTVKSVMLYFLSLTTISTMTLWVTEGARTVVHRKAIEVMTNVVELDGEHVRQEPHTFTEEYVSTGETIIDCWFTSVSAACVTGLIVTDTSTMTLAGQIVILVTIQAGGLGIIFFTSFLGFLVTREVSTRQELSQLHAEVLDVDPRFASRLLWRILAITLVCEGVATMALGSYFQWFESSEPLRGVNPWWWALFHSISAFNNAGFSLHPDNLMSFVRDPIVNVTLGSLIVLGGLGYAVLIRLWVWLQVIFHGETEYTQGLIKEAECVQASKLQTWLCLHTSFFLFSLGTGAVLLFDWSGSQYEGFSFAERLMVASFHSVSARTAGFNSVDLGQWSCGVLLIYIFLMYVGACPQGTAGGIKVTTLRLLMAYVANWFRPPYQHVVIRGRGGDWLVHRDTMTAAVRLFFASVLIIGIGTTLICFFEREHLIVPDQEFNYLKVAFEVVSAFGTVGLSTGYKDAVVSFAGIMTDDSKIVLILTMLIGRLGPLTVLGVFPWRRDFGALDLNVDERMERVQVG